MLHLTICESSPRTVQSLPPNLGTGLSHVRVRNLVPVPQDRVHPENSVHCENAPSTVKSPMNSRYYSLELSTCYIVSGWYKAFQIKNEQLLNWGTVGCPVTVWDHIKRSNNPIPMIYMAKLSLVLTFKHSTKILNDSMQPYEEKPATSSKMLTQGDSICYIIFLHPCNAHFFVQWHSTCACQILHGKTYTSLWA